MSTPRTSVKMAALAPMPSASVMTATDVNPGDLRSRRSAKRKSVDMANFLSCLTRSAGSFSFHAQRLHRVDSARSSRWYPACDERDQKNKQTCREDRK